MSTEPASPAVSASGSPWPGRCSRTSPCWFWTKPAEHLDLPTADALTADLLAATQGRTTVLITHRLEGLEAVDEVVVLEEGAVVQRGPYSTLAAVDGPLSRMLKREQETTAGSGEPVGARV